MHYPHHRAYAAPQYLSHRSAYFSYRSFLPLSCRATHTPRRSGGTRPARVATPVQKSHASSAHCAPHPHSFRQAFCRRTTGACEHAVSGGLPHTPPSPLAAALRARARFCAELHHQIRLNLVQASFLLLHLMPGRMVVVRTLGAAADEQRMCARTKYAHLSRIAVCYKRARQRARHRSFHALTPRTPSLPPLTATGQFFLLPAASHRLAPAWQSATSTLTLPPRIFTCCRSYGTYLRGL